MGGGTLRYFIGLMGWLYSTSAHAQYRETNTSATILAIIVIFTLCLILFFGFRFFSGLLRGNVSPVDAAAQVIKSKRKIAKRWQNFVDKAKEKADQ